MSDTDKIIMDIDPKRMTIAELELLEDLAGEPASAVMVALTTNRLSARGLRALVVVMKRREDPSFTADQASDLTLDRIEWLKGEDAGKEAAPDEG